MMKAVIILAVFMLAQVALPVCGSAPGSWEAVDEDLDIMALIEGEEPEGVSMIQRDSRLQDGAAKKAACAEAGTCGNDKAFGDDPFFAALAAEEEDDGVSFMQVGAQYKLGQTVRHMAGI
mmetsp:Transcript_24132/g.60240  ORF Transcript_24132/g.60240 Transcript_24132/m.60240 type:complete len:120 (-) Transcript_24132:86-445(-)|eukprot:CAMPEP_0115224016 /NCGR_PEP_ID=MMETSP0270-20121206/29352_1 /TAXON_ID=71861 /ORGANISM="Scrippsiella trochoidea, Strain CCMP3099" /LENGTH=119 /DNA_ID=CAMNT_0002638303 /DNA_START=107 /DNA_END=466 /DNA_ORIENTATION=+